VTLADRVLAILESVGDRRTAAELVVTLVEMSTKAEMLAAAQAVEEREKALRRETERLRKASWRSTKIDLSPSVPVSPGDRNGFPLGSPSGSVRSGSDPGSSPDLSGPSKPNKRSYNTMSLPGGFAEFWALYPRHVAKAAAVRAWIKIDPTSNLIQAIHAAIKTQAVDFLRREPEKVPHAATWLNGRRWEDEATPLGRGPSLGGPPARNFREEANAQAVQEYLALGRGTP
jgi:hypothetical protein